MLPRITFNQPYAAPNTYVYMADAIARKHISGDGYYSKQCHRILESELGVHKALLTTSCTDALEMAALLLNIQPGDEVIVPSFTFVSSINAFVLRGAKPVFADVRRDTLNLDETQLESLITPRTRAIVLVHYAGVACEMDAILAIAAKYGVPIVEDNAHGLFGKYKGRNLGTFGALATQSFHETKNITCGEGGALLINDPALTERAEIIREKGTNRSRFFRGQVDKYTWVDVGSSFLLSDLLAAYLYAQLEQWPHIQAARKGIWDRYAAGLAGWAGQHGVGLPHVPAHCEQPYHMFYLMLPSLDARQRLIAHLKADSIMAAFHYLPLHLSDMGRPYGNGEGSCPITEWASDRLLRLPFYNALSTDDQCRVIERVCTFQP